MPISVQTITSHQSTGLLTLAESHFVDLKAVDTKPAKLTEIIAALANSDGGEVYVGIDEDKRAGLRYWRGFTNQEAANAHIAVFERLFPLGREYQYTFLECPAENGLVLQIEVQKSREIKHASDGEVYIRRGAQTLRVTTPAELRQLEYTKGWTSFESESVNVDVAVVTESEKILAFMQEVVPTAIPETWLRKQQLIRDNLPTVAAVLLFAEEPQAILPKRCGIKVYRYTTRDKTGSRETLSFTPQTIEGPLYDQIRAAVQATASVVQEARKLGQSGLEEVQYPPEAIHEILTNAVLHRDYSLADDVHVRIFDNRIEIESPGRLPAHITVKNILDERFARNGSLVRLLNKFPDPPNKDVGEGLNTAFAAMTKLGLKEPTIEEKGNSVLVIIKHEPLASPEEVILQYLETHENIRNKVAREICHITGDYVVKEIFGRLVELGWLQKVAGTRTSSTAYEKGPNYDAWRRTHATNQDET